MLFQAVTDKARELGGLLSGLFLRLGTHEPYVGLLLVGAAFTHFLSNSITQLRLPSLDRAALDRAACRITKKSTLRDREDGCIKVVKKP